MLRSLVFLLVGMMTLSIAITVFGLMVRGKDYTIEELYAETQARLDALPQ
jgi:hypothetical protein